MTVTTATVPPPRPKPEPEPKPVGDRRCWHEFGGDRQRSLAREKATLGLPARKHVWTRGLGSYIEYPPSYCDGTLYVNAFEGEVFAIDSETGKVRWRRDFGGTKPSTPAIDGPRLIVSSRDGTVTALDRERGRQLWRVATAGKVESSPVVVDGVAYFGVTDGRLYAVQSATGRIRWAYQTGGRINSSRPYGRRVCVSTYAGSIFCLNKDTGARLWSTYVRRDAFRYESFYASASTDGARVYCVARSGKVVALDAQSGRLLWTSRVGGLGYTTPAIANGLVFVGGFDGNLRASREDRSGGLASARQRPDPGWRARGRRLRLLLGARAHVRRAHLGRRDRLAPPDGALLARHRDRADVLLLAERAAHRVPRAHSVQAAR